MSGYDADSYQLALVSGDEIISTPVDVPRVSIILGYIPDPFAFHKGAAHGHKMAQKGYETATAYRDERGALGSRVHDLIESSLRAGLDKPRTLRADLRPYFDSFLKWWEKEGGEILHVEPPLFSIKYGYAGTCDLIYKSGADIIVADWKTGRILPKSELQNAAYAQAAVEMGLVPYVNRSVTVGLRESGKPEPRWWPRSPAAGFERFLKCLRNYHEREEGAA